MSRTSYEARIERLNAIDQAEEKGIVADSMDVRKQLLDRVRSGEMTLAQAQKELQKIKRSAKKNGMVTRNQVWRNS